MFNKLREKAHVFWLRHRGAIIGFGVFAVGTVGVGMAVNSYINKKDAERATAEEETGEALEKTQTEAAPEKETGKIVLDCGGYIEPFNDSLDARDYPNALVNTVPISAMGDFGKEMLNMVNYVQFGEFAEQEGFKQETATVDVVIDFGHEKWKQLNPEKVEESQEKQAS